MSTTPIEFMAWDKVLNKITDNVDHISFETKQVKIAYKQYFQGELVHPFTWYRKYDELELMQLTALRSINDEPIYNHMIVKDAFEMHYLVDMFDYYQMWMLSRADLEIVGNSFQNPELLELCK